MSLRTHDPLDEDAPPDGEEGGGPSGMSLDISGPAALPERPTPFIEFDDAGRWRLLREPDMDTDFTPAAREIYGDDWMGAIRFLSQSPADQRAKDERGILQEFNIARKMGGVDIPNFHNELNVMGAGLTDAERAGMTEDEYRHWRERDPKYVADQITDRDILRLSGPDGYVTRLARDPDQREMARRDAVLYARMEADYLGQTGGVLDQLAHDFRSGFGQVGVLGVRGMAALSRGISDFTDWTGAHVGERDPARHAADWWNEYAKDAESGWSGATIDTGRPVFDFVRTAIGQGTPMLGAFMALSATPGVGTAGSSAIMGALMGGDTYLTLRNDGIDPALATMAAVPVGVVSYLTNKFTLDNLSRYLGGRSPFGLFSAGTALEVLEEGLQEVAENTTQATAEGLARIVGDPEYTSRKFWSDWKSGFMESLTEGGMAGISTAAMRLIGLPVAARNQMRASAFADSFAKTGATAAKTETFAKAPDVLAASLNAMARHHDGGTIFTSVGQLAQAGVAREQAVARVEDGGLGIDAKDYDKAAASESDIAVGFGNAVVFSQKQKEAGNAGAEGAFSISPDAMSIGDIRMQRLEAEGLVDEAETYFQQLKQGNEEGSPLRLRVFRSGLRAAGYDADQADALAAMYRAGAERHAAQWGVTADEWLDRKNVQLMMDQALLSSGRREANRYLKLLRELSERDAAPEEAEVAGEVPATEEAAAQGDVAPDIGPLTQPARGDADNRAWVDEVVGNIADALGLRGDEFGPLTAEIRKAVEQGVNDPDVRTLAESMGIVLPEPADASADEAEAEKGGAAWDMLLEIRKAKSQREVADFFTRKADELSGYGRGLFSLQQGPVGGNAEYFDIRGKTAPLVVINEPVWTGATTELRKRAKDALLAMRGTPHHNPDTGWSITIGRDAVDKTLNESGRPEHFQALEQLPKLLRNAVLVRKSADAKGRKDVNAFYRLYAPISVGGKIFAAQITVREDLESNRRFYVQRLLIKNPAVDRRSSAGLRPAGYELDAMMGDGGAEERLRSPGSSISTINIPQLLRDVKSEDARDDSGPSAIETLYQDESNLSSPRGSITFTLDATVINLFKGADVSTVVHELNHLFLDDLIKMVKAGKGGAAAARHLDTLDAFAGGGLLSGDADARRKAYEKIASAWERYAMEGVAPSNALEDPFEIFRKYISLAYRNTLDALEEPSPEVRRVFDRFLATDDEIAAAARRRELREDWTRAGVSSESVKQKMAAVNARRDARKRRREDARNGGGRALRREGELDSVRRAVRGELAEEPVYRAVDIAKAKGGMNRANAIAAVGEAAVERIEDIHGKGVFAEGYDAGVPMGQIAAMAGYSVDAAAGMLADMAAAEGLDARTDRDARERQGAYDAFEEFETGALEDAEGVDLDTDDPAEDADPLSPGDMTEGQEQDADIVDMSEEVEAAIEDEITAGGGDESLERKRELQRRLAGWRDQRAALARQARDEVFAKSMREATDFRAYRSDRSRAKRNAFAAADRGDRAAVARWKRREMLHLYRMKYARKARALRKRIMERYGPGSLRSTIDAAEHDARVEFEYAKSLARTAIYAGMADSRFLRQTAGDDGDRTLALPKEDPDLGGLVTDIADTLPDWLLAMERPEGFRDFRDFTVEQLYEIDRLMRWLIDNGRGKLNAVSEREAATLGELVEKSTDPMEWRKSLESTGGRDARTRWNKTLNNINRFLISLTIPENWFMAMDGNPTIRGGEMGVNQRLFRAMVDADVKRDILYKRLMTELSPHFDALNAERERWEKAVGGRFAVLVGLSMPDIMKRGRDISTWDFDLLLSVALNMGNDANLRRLLSDEAFALRFGLDPEQFQSAPDAPRYNFTNEQLAIVAKQFSSEGWRAVQGILDGVNSLFGEADATTFRLTNRHVVKEKPTPHVVETSDGEVLHLAGGYFPLVNDPRLSTRSAQIAERTNIEDQIRSGLLANVHGAARREVGALKGRARNEQGVPMVTLPQILSSSIIVQHIDVMAHYITHAEILRDMDRLTRNETWRAAYVDKFGQEQYRAVRKWLKNLAAPERGSDSPGERFLERLRGLATVGALGLRWKTGLKQRLGAFQAAAFMTDASGTKSSGWKWLAVGVKELGFAGNLGIASDKTKFVLDKADFMRARAGSFDREVRAMRDRLSPLHREYFGKSAGEWQNLAFAWIQANDQAMTAAVWLGAYRQALAGEANVDVGRIHREMTEAGKGDAEINEEIERQAVLYANSAAATQASSFAADLTENQRDRGFMRFVSMFMSGNVRQGSRLLQYLDARGMGDKTTGDVLMLAVREFVFPSLAWVFVAAAVKSAACAAFGMEDDDDNLLAEAFWETLDTAAAPFPLIRQLPSIAQYGFMSGDVPAVGSTARAVNSLFGVPGKLADAKYMQAVGKTMDAVGYALGIPVMNPLNDSGISNLIGLKARKGGK